MTSYRITIMLGLFVGIGFAVPYVPFVGNSDSGLVCSAPVYSVALRNSDGPTRIRHEFTIRNVSSSTKTIRAVVVGCNCRAETSFQEAILPSSTGTIVVEFDSAPRDRRPDIKNFKVFVEGTDDPVVSLDVIVKRISSFAVFPGESVVVSGNEQNLYVVSANRNDFLLKPIRGGPSFDVSVEKILDPEEVADELEVPDEIVRTGVVYKIVLRRGIPRSRNVFDSLSVEYQTGSTIGEMRIDLFFASEREEFP